MFDVGFSYATLRASSLFSFITRALLLLLMQTKHDFFGKIKRHYLRSFLHVVIKLMLKQNEKRNERNL
jgi:hypothetical protein